MSATTTTAATAVNAARGASYLGQLMGVVTGVANSVDNSEFLARINEAAYPVFEHARDPMATVVQLALLLSKSGAKLGFDSYQVVYTQGVFQALRRTAAAFNHHQLKQLEGDVILALHRYEPWKHAERRLIFIYALEGLNFFQRTAYPTNKEVDDYLKPTKEHIFKAFTTGKIPLLPPNGMKEGMDKWTKLVEGIWAAKNKELARLNAELNKMQALLTSIQGILDEAKPNGGDEGAAKKSGKAATANDNIRKLLEARLKEKLPPVAEGDAKVAHDDKMPTMPTWQECHTLVAAQWTDDEFKDLHKHLTGKAFVSEGEVKLLTELDFTKLKDTVKLPTDLTDLNRFVEKKIARFAEIMNVALEALVKGRTFHDLWTVKEATSTK